MKTIVIKYSGLLFIGFLIEKWLFDYSNLEIPRYIPHTPWNVEGLYLIALLLVTLIFANKSFLKAAPSASISRHTLLGVMTCFFSELVFQLAKLILIQQIDWTDKLERFYIGIAGMTIFGSFLAFFVAFQIKTRKTRILLLFIAAFLGLCLLIKNRYMQSDHV